MSAVGVFIVGLESYDEGATAPWWFDAWAVLTWVLLGMGVIGLLVTVAAVVREALRRR